MKKFTLNLMRFFYKNGLRPAIFLFDPEKIHDITLKFGKILGTLHFKNIWSPLFNTKNKILEQEILGIKFANPVGLAAGYDKNAELTQLLGSLGFGFEEVGSISNLPCSGNPKPRLWRLPKSRGIIVWNGLMNKGAKTLHEKLDKLKFDIPVGVSIVKTNSPEITELNEAVPDVISALKIFSNFGDYITLNISCPNTAGDGLFYNPKNLKILLSRISELKLKQPIFIKLPPDLNIKNVDEIIDLAREYKISGFVLSNIVKRRDLMDADKDELKMVDPGRGSMSGKPVEKLSNELISYVYKKTKGEFVIIGCGGVFSAKDAYKKIRAGASLIQLITGLIFEGPQLVAQINSGLVELLKKDGFSNISQAIGADSRN